MLSKQLEELLKERKKVLYIFWFGQLAVPVIFSITGYIIISNLSIKEPINSVVTYVLSAMALISLIISFKPSLFFSDKWIKNSLSSNVDPSLLATDQQTSAVNHGLLKNLENLNEEELKIFNVICGAFFRQIIYWGIVETIAIFGYVLMILTTNFNLYLLFGSISFIRMLTLKPNYDFLLIRIRLIKERH